MIIRSCVRSSHQTVLASRRQTSSSTPSVRVDYSSYIREMQALWSRNHDTYTRPIGAKNRVSVPSKLCQKIRLYGNL